MDDVFFPMSLAYMTAGAIAWLVGYGVTPLITVGVVLVLLKAIFNRITELGTPLA